MPRPLLARLSAPVAAAVLSLTLLPTAGAQGIMGGMIEGPPSPLPSGTPAPAFQTTTVSGKPLSLKSLRGHVVLLDYWATWCGPCRMAAPTLEALHRKFVKRGLTVIGMSVDDPRTVALVRPLAKRLGMTYTVSASPQANGRAAAAYHVDGIPSQYLIDKRGVVRWSQSGFSTTEGEELSAMITLLLAEKA